MKNKRVSHKRGEGWIDPHLHAAMTVAKNTYFVVAAASANEVAGLLVGTEVMRIRDIEQRPSKYWKGDYYSALVECPNGETRKLGCDSLAPRKTDKHFLRQRRCFKSVAIA